MKTIQSLSSRSATAAFLVALSSKRTMVSIHGRITLRAVPRQISDGGIHSVSERPPDPQSFLAPRQLQENVEKLLEWLEGKESVLCLTGAGLSTESGIPDYRGHGGSYHNGHKPMIHDQFMSSEAQRKRYWGRSMVGWRQFHSSKPNSGHYALAELERMGRIGVSFGDKLEYYRPENEMDWTVSSGVQRLSIITQNVDGLHRRAGMKHITELHGRTDRLKCMNCGTPRAREDFHDALEGLNHQWLEQVISERQENDLRPDGDGFVARDNYDDVEIPPCNKCGGFLKPDVVFFGDSVPRHRVERCRGAVEASDGLLCIGSSLAVHSAFRFVRTAASKDIPVAVLNVGKTRAETEGLEVIKIESPAGPTLSACAQHFKDSTGTAKGKIMSSLNSDSNR